MPTEDRRTAEIAAEVAAEWGIALGERIPSKHSFIALVGEHAILKVFRPEIPEYEHPADALALWDGDHAIRLLRHDRSRRAMLLERAIPGHDLSTEAEDDVYQVAVEVGRALWIPAPQAAPFRRVIELCRRWLDEVIEQDRPLAENAMAVLEHIRPQDERVVHGDLHHHNILRRGSSWAAIDPQPAIGEPEYDVVTLLWNPVGVVPTRDRTIRWLTRLASAGLDMDRVREWGIVRGTILSFSSRPGRRHEPQLHVARWLLELMR